MFESIAKTLPVVVPLIVLSVLAGWWLRGSAGSFRLPRKFTTGATRKREAGEAKSPAGGKGKRSSGGGRVVLPTHQGTRVIVHIGMPKSGTTALQQTLRANRNLLKRHGVIYPAGGGLPSNHNILVVPFSPVGKLPRIFQQVYKDKPEQRMEDVRKVIQAVAAQVREKKAHTVILSGEMLFKALNQQGIDEMRAMLRPIGDRITVVAYIRHPANFYLSMAQQAIKASSRLPQPKGRRFRRILESYGQVGDEMIVNAYDRNLLHGGDISLDFCKKVLGFDDSVLAELNSVRSNETMTAEGMDILMRYRKYACKGQNGVFTADTNLIGKVIREVDQEIPGFGRPVLNPEAVESIVRSAVDLPWLKETWGIAFPDVDYSVPFDEKAEAAIPRRVSDVCKFDKSRRDQLLFRVLQQLAKNQGSEKINFKTAMPDSKP